LKKKKKLKGFRIRVTIDFPIWEYSKEKAIETAKKIAPKSHSASKVMKAECILEGEPNNLDLFPEEWELNPSSKNKYKKKEPIGD